VRRKVISDISVMDLIADIAATEPAIWELALTRVDERIAAVAASRHRTPASRDQIEAVCTALDVEERSDDRVPSPGHDHHEAVEAVLAAEGAPQDYRAPSMLRRQDLEPFYLRPGDDGSLANTNPNTNVIDCRPALDSALVWLRPYGG
jgi:hypothetical protein